MTTPTAVSGPHPVPARPGALLRLALRLDAVVTGANAVAYVAAAPLLSRLLGLPVPALRGVGAFLLVFTAGVWLVGSRPRISPTAVRAVIALNVLWALDSLVAAAAGWGSPTALGTTWIVLQALVVAGFAALQPSGARAAR